MSEHQRTATAGFGSADDLVARIFEWRRGFNAMHLIDIGLRLDLFAALAGGTRGSADLAASLDLHPPYVETWCKTAYAFGLLELDDDGCFRLAEFADQVLADPSNPRYLGGYVRLGTEFATEDHRYCPEAFRTGSVNPFQGRTEQFARTVAEATAGLHVLSARKLLPALPGLAKQLGRGGTIVELGCGTGRHLSLIARTFPAARCIGVDIDPTGIELARAELERAGVAERVRLVAGGLDGAVGAGEADAVVMIEVLHEIAADIRGDVLSACCRALRPGGWLMIVDETYPETPNEMRSADFQFPIQTGFEELTWGNTIPTRRDQEMLLRGAGFDQEISRSMVGEGFTVLATRKAG